MKDWPSTWTVAQLGEKAIIAEIIRPIFEEGHAHAILGHDSAVLRVPPGFDLLLSTDRVPADLTAFRLGLIDYSHLGRYLATLNFSDIAASGGKPCGLLLNLGLPANLLISQLLHFCAGVRAVCDALNTRVVGGDITSSEQISVSATAVGSVPTGKALRRSGAPIGDWVFAARPIGLTPAALVYFIRGHRHSKGEELERVLVHQFRGLVPQIEKGQRLLEVGICTASIDNTDGLAQSLLHITEESNVAIIIDRDKLEIPSEVSAVAEMVSMDVIDLALGPGADFSLVGTIRASSDKEAVDLCAALGIALVGRVVPGEGIFLQNDAEIQRFGVRGWNYFVEE